LAELSVSGRVVGAELLLALLERAAEERLGLGELALLVEQHREVRHDRGLSRLRSLELAVPSR
jgi:hypothetical protein